jgi:Flp pilus assembly protein TadG
MVEFAVVLPVALFLLLGILQMSYLLYAYHATGNAARLGARWLALHGANCSDTANDAQGNALCPAGSAALKYYVEKQMPGLDPGSLTIATPIWKNPPTTWNYAPTTCTTSAVGGCIANVSLTYQFKWLGGVLGLPTRTRITSESQFIAQGP